MAYEDTPDMHPETWLQILGIESICLGRRAGSSFIAYQTSLANAEYIARLLGLLETNPVIAGLECLEALGFCEPLAGQSGGTALPICRARPIPHGASRSAGS